MKTLLMLALALTLPSALAAPPSRTSTLTAERPVHVSPHVSPQNDTTRPIGG